MLISPVLRSKLPITKANELTTVVSYIASINYGTTFYIHCLTSGLFRQEFYNVMRYILRSNCRRIGVVLQMIGPIQLQVIQTAVQKSRNKGRIEIDNN
ncbi:hypothetical protein I4U23_008672 [Adineta vaga]|nr:hypothetical protein I4U23_008672 [Adineta vaga]